jgi:hypothetical protein
MIPNHPRFLEAIKEHRKVRVTFHPSHDNGVHESVCAPMDYGSGGEIPDGEDSYWLWDYGNTGNHTLKLESQQIVEMQVLGEEFNPGYRHGAFQLSGGCHART